MVYSQVLPFWCSSSCMSTQLHGYTLLSKDKTFNRDKGEKSHIRPDLHHKLWIPVRGYYNQRLSRSIISQIWCAEWGKRECSSYLLIQNMGDTLKLQTINCATSTNVNELDTTGKTNTDILKTPWAWWIFMTTNEGLLS